MGYAVVSAGQLSSARSHRRQRAFTLRSTLWLLLAFPALALADLEAEDDDFVGLEDTPLTRNVFGNDSQDPGAFGLASFTQPSQGTVSFDAGGNFTYNPNGDYSGPDQFTYTIQPVGGLCLLPPGLQPPYCADRETATVDLEIEADADAPIISVSNVAGDEDTTIALSLSAVVADTDGSETLVGRLRNVPIGATINGATDQGGGVWLISGTDFSGISATPPLNDNGVVSLEFSVVVTDTASNTDTETLGASFTVRVDPVDDAPTLVAAPAPVSVPEDGAIAVDLSGIFSDVDSPLTLSIASIGGDAVTVSGTETIGGLTLTADLIPEANGTVNFEVEADDGVNAPVSTTVTVNVTEVNDTPVLVAPLADVDVNEDAGTINVSVAGAFDDADIATNGDALTYTLATSGDSLFTGTSVTGNTLNFTLAANANGAVNVVVTATDNAGAFAQDSFALVVNAVNDAPTVINPIGTVALPEDAPAQTFDLLKVFDDVDILTNGDVLNFTITSNTNPGLFSDLSISGDKLTLEVAPDTNGTATVVIEASDGDVTVSDSFTVTVAFVNDIPIPEDDAVTMVEDSGAILIDVLANDFEADAPATIFSAGNGGFSDSPSNFRYLDTNGDTVDQPDGTVTIVGNQIQYEPEANFVGTDTFTYKIQDCCLPDESNPGEVSVEATVTVTVLQANDPPEPNAAVRTFTMFTNDTLVIDSNLSLIRDTYDLEFSTLDPSTGDTVGGTITATVVSAPDAGGAFSFASDGTFSYTPPIDYQGITEFTYLVQDDVDSAAAVNTVRIDVREPPAPATPPTPGEVAVTFDLATTPLEQANGVTPNVLIMMDDSGYMDWNITTQGEANDGVIRLSNE
ncbi:MAG: Ig-like domain-containing protein, partial [Pseudomonadota bacterium]